MNQPDRPVRDYCQECGSPLNTGAATSLLCFRCALENALEARLPVDLAAPVVQPKEDDLTSAANQFPRTFGDYELLEELGRGGMGVVYKARQQSLGGRTVAIKMILAGLFSQEEFVMRFHAEAAAAAVLQHPNIVAVHEVGAFDGQHYFSMDYVPGRTLAEILREGPLPSRKAAAHMRAIAAAIQYAHEQGVLHRDLKPSNVVIDAEDRPRITDFGLAKREMAQTQLTLTGQILGSPGYMAPEQAEGRRGEISRASDIYALGAMLYHLLTGRPPFHGETLGETLRLLLNTDPVPPRLLNPTVPVDLQTICLKCLEKEPGKRYPDAGAVAAELGRFLEDQPILARPAGTAERCWRWCRRNPLIAGLSAAAVVILLLGFAGVLWQAQRANRAAAEAEIRREETRQQRDVAEGRLYAAQMKLVDAAYRAGRIGAALQLLRGLAPRPGQADFRGFDWRFLYRLCSSSQSEELVNGSKGIQAVQYSPDGRTLAFGTVDGVVEILDVRTRQRIRRWRAHKGAVDDLAYYPKNSGWLATASGDEGSLKLWDFRQGRALMSIEAPKGMWVNFTFSPTGRFLAAGASDAQSVNLWEVHLSPANAPKLTLTRNFLSLGPASFSPDEHLLALCNSIGTPRPGVTLFDLDNDRIDELPIQHTDLITCLAFSPDGSRLVTGGADERVLVRDLKKRAVIRDRITDLIVITRLVFTPDGQTLFASGWDPNIRLWDMAEGDERRTLPGHNAGVNGLAAAPDGRTLASASRDGTVRLWSLQGKNEDGVGQTEPTFQTLLKAEDNVSPELGQLAVLDTAVAPDQHTVAATTWEQLVLLDLRTGSVLARLSARRVFGARQSFKGIAFSPDGRRLAVGSGNGQVALLNTATLEPVKKPFQLHGNQVRGIAFCLDGNVLATSGGFGAMVKLTNLNTGRLLHPPFRGVEGFFPPQPMAVSPDRKLLATGSPEQLVRVWDIASGRLTASSPRRVRFLHALAFSPDGRLLAYSDELGTIFTWDLKGQKPFRQLVSQAGPANTLAFSPDGRTLAAGYMDHSIRLWHPDIGQEVAVLTGHQEWVWCVAFAEHGNALLSGSRDGTLRVWRALSMGQITAAEQRRVAGARLD